MSFFSVATIAAVCLLTCTSAQPALKDVTFEAGIRQDRATNKWGGPCVADLDQDGHYDLILSHHLKDPVQLYFGKGDGTFIKRVDFETKFKDVHGIQVGPRTAKTRERILSVSVGGGRGSNLKRPELFSVKPDRSIKDISTSYGFGKIKSRGRNSIFMNLDMKSSSAKRKSGGGPDIIFASYLGVSLGSLRQYSYQNNNGYYSFRPIPVFARQLRGRVEVTDIDGDGVMEIISIRHLEIFKLVAPFTFAEITSQVLPPDFTMPRLSGTSVVEFDMDNDGDMDLYVARADRRRMTLSDSLPGDDHTDFLLENRGGKYVDVSEKAGIRERRDSMGVTAGDFNNDGFVDLFITTWKGRDYFLMNKGGGRFNTIIDTQIRKPTKVIGNNGMAFDYNRDGRIDLMVGQGDREGPKGYWRLLKNVMQLTNERNYLHVFVRNAQNRGATSLHAVVTVVTGRRRMTRRVGSRGAQAGGGSYLDTVHFGFGSFREATVVMVRWSNGVTQRKYKVRANQRITFGVL
ncbi:unnamed protein product [Chondrus crispus]|uniref:ASPIC/UnbV domain-containing protein n=1 Tax=Chondrus crispus TaxID=2769 RepID=R7Q5U1_CHOCR|nr:unnamed protein product [Chondrus crispus]CDF33384.1 unnamed protein product [Chondrus crispus]|eukprot:XP_005713187.1 unnamed protein product [Chondrus crispus]